MQWYSADWDWVWSRGSLDVNPVRWVEEYRVLNPWVACLEDGETRWLIGEGNVDRLIETTRMEEGGIELIRSIRDADDENVLLGVYTIHLG